ncbi:MAG: OmpA family protein [Terriglobia bacterium]
MAFALCAAEARKAKQEHRFESDEVTTLQVSKNGQETWVSVEPYGSDYTLIIVERRAMQQEAAANAEALQGGLAQEGHVAVPGIFFDSNKSDVKPESKTALEEVAKLLKTNPTMRVWVAGHTDSVGMIDANMKLSDARAAAVVSALVANDGISATRLKGYSVGPLAPAASNDTEEGKAKNRRVELVKQQISVPSSERLGICDKSRMRKSAPVRIRAGGIRQLVSLPRPAFE